MQHQPEPRPMWSPAQDARTGMAILAFVGRVLAAPAQIILRTRHGERFAGAHAACALILIPFWGAFWPEESPAGMLWLWMIYIVMLLRSRAECARLRRRGEPPEHSLYDGRPRLASVFRKADERRIKAAIEPLCVLLAGFLLLPLSVPLGMFLLASAIALALVGAVAESVERGWAIEINDAWIEQRQLMERFRRMQR